MTTPTEPQPARRTTEDVRTIDLHAWLYLLRDKWRFIAACIVGMLLLAGIYLFIKTPLYTAQALVEVPEDTANVVNIQDVNRNSYKSDEALKSVEGAFNSNSLLLRVAKVNELEKEEPDFRPAAGLPPFSDYEIARLMFKKVDNKLRRGSRTIEINFDSTSPQRSAKVTRSIIDEYVKTFFEQQAGMTAMANASLFKQLAELKDKVARSEQAMQAYREKYGTTSIEDRQNVNTDYLKQLNLKLEEARSNRIKIEGDLTTLRKAQALPFEELIAMQSVSGLPDVQDTLKLITSKESEFSQIKKRYLPLHPKYIQSQSELAALHQSLEKTARKGASIVLNTYKAAQESEAKLKLALREQQKSGVEISGIAIPFNELQRQADTDRKLYEDILARSKETKLSETLDRNNIRVVQEPIPPKYPSKPKVILIIPIAFVLGCMIALGVIIVGQAFDTSLRSIDQAESTLDLPSLAAVPEAKLPGRRKDKTSPLVLVDSPGSREAEAFRCLRTSLSLLPAGAPKSTLFTSAIPAEGKSFCAANYAVALAQQKFRTIIIDADLRRPGLGPIFPTPDGAAGLSDLLAGKAVFTAACHDTKVNGLTFMPAGARNANPLELLTDEKFAQVMREALEKFDRVILDSAPVNAVSDTLTIVEHVGAVAFVIRARRTPARTLLRAIQLLENAGGKPAGFILNRLPSRLAGYYYFDAGNYSSAGVYGT